MNLIDRLYAREVNAAVVGPEGGLSANVPVSPVVLAGSFNPLHRGHRGLLEECERETGRDGWFEMSIENVDKPDLERAELDRRLAQFRAYRGVVLTRAPRFIEKARVLRGTVFAIGFDTAVRLIDDRYYDPVLGDGAEPRWAAVLREISDLGCGFMVAGRAAADNGRFRELYELSIPDEFRPMFRVVPESEFREDISSTDLREKGLGSG